MIYFTFSALTKIIKEKPIHFSEYEIESTALSKHHTGIIHFSKLFNFKILTSVLIF